MFPKALCRISPSSPLTHRMRRKEVDAMKEPSTACVCVVGSMTQALKAQQVLAKAAIPSDVIKTETASSHRGCVYGIRFFCGQENNVRTVLSGARIQVKQWKKE